MTEAGGTVRTASTHLRALIDANAPLWAGEAEVFRAYWNWPGRSRATDLRWLALQCYKELEDGFVPRLEQLRRGYGRLDHGISRHALLESAKGTYEELAHYCAFADAHEALRGDEPRLSVEEMRARCNWPENVALGQLRAEHRGQDAEMGGRASLFTEGGYCTLYSEGMNLTGRGADGADEVIARACAVVYGDEWEHMLQGIAGLDEEAWDEAGWARFNAMTVAQLRLRVRMRNAQFGYPLPEERIRAIEEGEIDPLPFDYRRAGLVVPVG